MNLDDQIEAALRGRPSDERTYVEPLTALGDASGAIEKLRPAPRAGRVGRRSGLAGLAVVVAVVAGIVAIGPRLQNSSTLVGTGPTQIQCRGWDVSAFSPDLLAGSGNAENGTSAAAGTLRQFIASAYGSDFPAHGWYLVADAPDRAVFIARIESTSASDYVEVELNRGASSGGQFTANGWSAGVYGSCTLRSVPPPGFVSALWGLDPAFPLTAETTELHIAIDPETCTSGKPIPADQVQVGAAYVGNRVVVTAAARQPDGIQTCQLTVGSSTPYVVTLDAPLGNRELQDGGPWPAEIRASGGHVFVPPTPSPYPSDWHVPTDCTGTIDDAGFFKAAAMSAGFLVYCAVLPPDWSVDSRSGPDGGAADGKTPLIVSYRGPNGETLELREGPVCAASPEICALPTGARSAPFGDRQGQFYTVVDPGVGTTEFAASVGAGQDPAWLAIGKGMSAETFNELTAALIIVGNF